MNMKSNLLRILAAVIMLSSTMCKSVSNQNKEVAITESESEREVTLKSEGEEKYDWKKYIVFADRKRDEAGMFQL